MYKIKELGKKGRGLVATQNIPRNKIIIKDEFVVLPRKDIAKIRKTRLMDYVFDYRHQYALVFGDGSLINNGGSNSNVVYEFKKRRGAKKTRQMIFKAKRKIKKGEELTIDYGRDPNDEPANATY